MTRKTVAIVGRPNVGKSTLFNRLVGRRRALVHPTPGVTRDRHAGEGRLGELVFAVTDTPGLEEAPEASLEGRMMAQTAAAVDAADVALLLIDARAGVTPLDEHFADWLRRRATPVVLVANKCEGRGGEAGLLDAYSLGLGDPVALSAEHGEGMGDLHARLAPLLGEPEPEEAAPAAEPEGEGETEAERPLQLAIIGRPNVGKSTLINRLVGEERVLTGPEPGITRDAIEVTWRYDDRAVCLVDTAGLRRRARVDDKLEGLSAGQTWHALRFAEVAVVVMDATDMPHRQDLAIASAVLQEGRALVLAANKWDLIDDPRATLRGLRDRLQTSLPQARGVPVVTLSAQTGAGCDKLMRAVLQAHDVWNRRLATGALNRWLTQMTEAHPPPMQRGRPTKCRYITQIKTRPPTFGVWVNQPAALPESYLRYLVNGLRQDFDLPGTPIRIVLRKGKNPYAGKAA